MVNTAVFDVFLISGVVQAATTVFFTGSQTATHVASGDTSETISSGGYLFTYSLDKWWYPTISIGPGTPTGRLQPITWPAGVDAQTQTAGPSGLMASQVPATITVKRVDGQPFAVASFTAKLLGNTAGAGAAFEIMPLLNGNDGFPNPLTYDATGYAGNLFTYSTPELTGFDTYNLSLWEDYGLVGLKLLDATGPDPVLAISRLGVASIQLSWPTNSVGYGLEYATNLPAQSWNPVTNSVVVAGGVFTVQFDIATGQ